MIDLEKVDVVFEEGDHVISLEILHNGERLFDLSKLYMVESFSKIEDAVFLLGKLLSYKKKEEEE